MNKPKKIFKTSVALASVLALLIITVTMTPLANSFKGFFTDITRFDGAITGTKYENASNEIKVNVIKQINDNANDVIPLQLVFENPNEAPFLYIQEIAVSDYMIIDNKTGEVLKLECYPEYSGKATIKEGRASLDLSINNIKLESGKEYTLVIKKMYGLSKADAPLYIDGSWECSFKR